MASNISKCPRAFPLHFKSAQEAKIPPPLNTQHLGTTGAITTTDHNVKMEGKPVVMVKDTSTGGQESTQLCLSGFRNVGKWLHSCTYCSGVMLVRKAQHSFKSFANDNEKMSLKGNRQDVILRTVTLEGGRGIPGCPAAVPGRLV